MHHTEPDPTDSADEARAYGRFLRERLANCEREHEILTRPHWLDCTERLRIEVSQRAGRYGAWWNSERYRRDCPTLDAYKFAVPWRTAAGKVRYFEEGRGYLKAKLMAEKAVWFEARMRDDDRFAARELSKKIIEGRVATEEDAIGYFVRYLSDEVFVFPDGSALTPRVGTWHVLAPNKKSLSDGRRYLPVKAYVRLSGFVEELFRGTPRDRWSRVARIVYGRMPEALLECPSPTVRGWAITHLTQLMESDWPDDEEDTELDGDGGLW